MAVVGLEMIFYNVSESDGEVTVCAIVYEPTSECPISFSFNVLLSTKNDTPGIVQ